MRILCIFLFASSIFAQDVIKAPFDGLKDLPLPRIDNLEPRVAAQLKQAQDELLKEIKHGDRLNTGNAYGVLGEIYHSYKLKVEAEICYFNTLALDELRMSTIYLYARLLHEAHRTEEAIPLYDRFSKRHKNYGAVFYHLGDIALDKGEFDKASGYFRKSLGTQEHAAGYMALGRVEMARENYAEAIKHFERSLEILPQATRLNYFIATALRKMGKVDEAKERMKLAGKIGPRMPDPLFGRLKGRASSARRFIADGKAAFAAGDYNSAAKLFQQALEANPDSTTAMVNLASALAGLGDLEGAERYFKDALVADPRRSNTHYNLGRIYTIKKDFDQAFAHMNWAVELNDEDADAHAALIDLYASKKNYEATLPHLDKFIKLRPNSEEYRLRRVQTLAHIQRYEDAAEIMANEYEFRPDLINYSHYYARFLATCPNKDLRNGEKAVKLATHVVSEHPLPIFMETLALAEAQNGNCDVAKSWAEKAIAGAKEKGEVQLIIRLERDLERYQAGTPCELP